MQDPSPGGPSHTIRALEVIPGDPSGPSMIFAKEQVSSLRALGIDARTFYLATRTSPPGVLRELLRLRREAARLAPDIVHAHYGTVTAILCALASPAPLVITYQGSDLNPVAGSTAARTAVAHVLSQLAALRAARIVCVSAQLRTRLWWRRGIATVIPAGVDITRFAPADHDAARDRLGWGRDDRVVLFNAGPRPEIKRLDLAQAAVDEARRLSGDVRMVVLDGTVDPAGIPSLMNAADCLLLTSDREGSPMVVKEAIACGLPVVTVEVGDVRERLAGVEPSAIVPRDARALGRAVADMLARGRRSNGPHRAGVLSLERVAARVRDVYDLTLAGRGPRAAL